MEVWKDIEGYKGYYQVSSEGRVRSLDRVIEHPIKGDTLRKGKVLKQHNNSKYGHKQVRLCKTGNGKSHKVHSLVLNAFFGPCPEGFVCRHLDGDPANNVIENLCWGTYEENMLDMVRHGNAGKSKGETNGNSKWKEEDALFIHNELLNGKTEADIYKNTKYPKHFVNDVARGRTWSYITGRKLKKVGPKLTEEQVNEICKLVDKGNISQTKIASMYGISRAYVGKLHKKRASL